MSSSGGNVRHLRIPGQHPPPRLLAAFLRAEEDPVEGVFVREHLEDGRCLPCLQEIHRVLGEARHRHGMVLKDGVFGPGEPQERRSALERASGIGERLRFIDRVEEALAPELAAALLRKPAPDRRQAVRSDERYRLRAVAEHLAARAREEVFDDVARAEALGRLAADAADGLPTAVYGHREVARVRALAYGALANALRVNDDLQEAERAMTLAFRWLDEGHGDPLDQAELLSLMGSLRMSQSRYREAEQALSRAAQALEAQGEEIARAKLLVKLAKVREQAGDPGGALEALSEADSSLGGRDLGRLRHYASHLRVGCLILTGRVDEARLVFDGHKPGWLDEMPGTTNRLRVTWREGQLLWAEGRHGEAEGRLREVREAFSELGHTYDVALVSLELACLYLEEGRTEEARELAGSLLPVFGSLEVHRNVLEALAVVHAALEAESATRQLLQETLQFLHRARTDPGLAFELSGA